MEGNNQNNNQQPQQDPRTVQPEIIGELRNEKIGKPLIVIELFLLFGIVIFALPIINTALNDENSQLYHIVHNIKQGNFNFTTTQKKEQYADGSQSQPLQPSTAMKYKGIVLKDFVTDGEKLHCTIFAIGNEVNLDEHEYYLEITSTSGNVLSSIKLTGNYEEIAKSVTLQAYGMTFNTEYSYSARVVEMDDSKYPDPALQQDARGFANLTCTKDTRTIVYKFQQGYLIGINDEDYIVKKKITNDEYMNLLKAAREKAEAFGPELAKVEEVEDGYKFNAVLVLNEDYKYPSSIVDYDYYPSNTQAKKIKYAEMGKGYDCR